MTSSTEKAAAPKDPHADPVTGKRTHESHYPTARLRVKGGKLQQLHQNNYPDAAPEWRDIEEVE